MKMTEAALREVARSRGYEWGAAEQSITRRYGNGWVDVDTSHEAYPRDKSRPVRKPATDYPAPQPETSGPGTELKGLLRLVGITSSPNCSCNAKAKQMDEWGPDVCESRLPEIVGWLEEQARARNLPFVRFAAEQVVKLAIRRARKSAAR